jgi:hypothetical protein
MSVDEVLIRCLENDCNYSREQIETELNGLSNPELQAWLRIHCRDCLSHDKRRKTENVSYISRLLTDKDTLRSVTDFQVRK